MQGRQPQRGASQHHTSSSQRVREAPQTSYQISKCAWLFKMKGRGWGGGNKAMGWRRSQQTFKGTGGGVRLRAAERASFRRGLKDAKTPHSSEISGHAAHANGPSKGAVARWLLAWGGWRDTRGAPQAREPAQSLTPPQRGRGNGQHKHTATEARRRARWASPPGAAATTRGT